MSQQCHFNSSVLPSFYKKTRFTHHSIDKLPAGSCTALLPFFCLYINTNPCQCFLSSQLSLFLCVFLMRTQSLLKVVFTFFQYVKQTLSFVNTLQLTVKIFSSARKHVSQRPAKPIYQIIVVDLNLNDSMFAAYNYFLESQHSDK